MPVVEQSDSCGDDCAEDASDAAMIGTDRTCTSVHMQGPSERAQPVQCFNHRRERSCVSPAGACAVLQNFVDAKEAINAGAEASALVRAQRRRVSFALPVSELDFRDDRGAECVSDASTADTDEDGVGTTMPSFGDRVQPVQRFSHRRERSWASRAPCAAASQLAAEVAADNGSASLSL